MNSNYELNGLKGFRIDKFVKDDMKIKTKTKGGEILLNLKDIAIGLNISFVATSGNEVVRWNRLKEYLSDIDPSVQLPEVDDIEKSEFYVSEWVFYMLCMKARNDKAKKFQLWIAKEVLPNIRRFGSYIAPDLIEKFNFTKEELSTGLHPIELIMRQAIESRESVIEYRDKYYDAQERANMSISDMASMKQLLMAMWGQLLKMYVDLGNRDKLLLNDLQALAEIVVNEYPQLGVIFEELNIIENKEEK